MDRKFDMTVITPLQVRLDQHRVYAALHNRQDLAVFMQHHIYSVWDFMSLIKYLQARLAPAVMPWVPGNTSSAVKHFINSLVLEEESDCLSADGETPVYASHFELYCRAMEEVGADPATPRQFVEVVAEQGIDTALQSGLAPAASRQFMTTTFDFIRQDKPHVVAAGLALGREHVIPQMFRAFLARMGIDEQQAPVFHFYLNRHIHLDEDFHGPLSLQLVHELCAGDTAMFEEAEQAAIQALEARLAFWDGVLAAVESGKQGQ
jgi:hypothetical protein